jgi:2-dehydropantoate 2-reductase
VGQLTGIPTPALDTVLALVSQRAKLAGLYESDRPLAAKAPAFA